ncbi:ROK family transcriptional regulator [Fibrisoma montanum]|uniref:ROK family transcriptional regulator n=1 Tax=Fibrisoma montanum TaxID=2305895 RepID=A0A418M4T1_9BACT|nr:ROK family transcriptional regulator [Fibrisoma montanum]RIV20719.1 ROK family transcriptional regulator [Fibrisoma montanum]
MTTLEDELVPRKSVVTHKKNQRLKSVLSYLYQEGACTLAQLADVSHTSIPSVTGLVDQLLEEGWVSANGIVTGNNGRRPTLFGLRPDGHYVIVLDSNTHDTRLLVVNPLRQIVFQRTVDRRLEDTAGFLDFLARFVTETLTESAIPRSAILAMGLAIPGLIDARRDLNLTYSSLNPTDQSITTWLEERLDIPVYLINDTKATALGENRFGGGLGKKHVLSINIDWGVGLGIILDGKVFQGASGFAGELGHIQVDPDGDLCYCGKVGCLDTITSASSLVRRVQRAVLDGCVSQLAAYQNDVSQITINHVIEAAHQGDAFAIDQLHETGYQLGKGLSIAINLFNPEVIIVDGVLAQAAIFITNPIEQAIIKHCLSGFRNDLTVEVTKLNGAAKWLGTHAYVMENVFADF